VKKEGLTTLFFWLIIAQKSCCEAQPCLQVSRAIRAALDLYFCVTDSMRGEATSKLDSAFRSAIRAKSNLTQSRVNFRFEGQFGGQNSFYLDPNRKKLFIFKAWRRGRVAEGGGLLNRYTGFNPYRGFESLRLRQI
jgi:hypothetical protein